jgi:hypothetical protein
MTDIEKDKELLKWYMKGFNDELWGTSSIVPDDKKRAYSIGASDAIIGDDVMSNDERSNEEILKEIKKF